jgi:hypothetical protein
MTHEDACLTGLAWMIELLKDTPFSQVRKIKFWMFHTHSGNVVSLVPHGSNIMCVSRSETSCAVVHVPDSHKQMVLHTLGKTF